MIGAASTRSNLGETTIRGRSRTEHPMRAYDALPRPLRHWLSRAAMPWSPASCRRIWLKARARGESNEALLARLDAAEQRTLARDPAINPAAATSRAADGHGPVALPRFPGFNSTRKDPT